jgi:hypothetical protein
MIPVKNRILLSTYEENPRYREEFHYDAERGDCIENEFFWQHIHREKDEYLLVRLQ